MRPGPNLSSPNRRHPMTRLRREADREAKQRQAKRGLWFAAACLASFYAGAYWPQGTDHSDHWNLVRTTPDAVDIVVQKHLSRDECLKRMFEVRTSIGCERETEEF